MIVCRAPFRVSFLGGGTDYPEWYSQHGGAVLSAAINRYCWVTVRRLRPFFDDKTRVIWNQIEHVAQNKDISHRNIRAVLQYFNIDTGVEVFYSNDLPSHSGLGTSSSLTVGLLLALSTLKGAPIDMSALANVAVFVERDMLHETVGMQDQLAAAYGGFNRIDISYAGKVVVQPQPLVFQLEDHLLLVYTGNPRDASKVATKHVAQIETGLANEKMNQIMELVTVGQKLLMREDFKAFGELIHESWMLKRSISPDISTEAIDEIYGRARHAGAWGGKLCGAGGGGFMLLVAPPSRHVAIMNALPGLKSVPVVFETKGAVAKCVF